MPAVASSTFAGGRVHREAEANASLLRDRALCSLHVVALPEQMPLREAAQTVKTMRELDLATGALFVNRCVVPAPDGVTALLPRIELPAVSTVLHRAHAWQAIQERGIADIEDELFVRALRLPRQRAADELARCRALDPYVSEVAS
jgi:anion-transporting  ArsA/GET3 family ATPase